VPDGDLVIVFPTTHLTLKAETVLEQTGVKHRTVMKPRKISSDCGLAIRIDADDLQRIRELLEGNSLSPAGFFMETEGGWEPVSRPEDR
jgi:hypothetical protein